MKASAVLLVLYYWFHNSVAQKGLQCFVPGECLDSQILGATPTNNSRECWRHCQSTTGCTWFTFYKDSQVCTPLSGCLRLSNEKCQDNCVSGEEECPEVQCGVHGRCYGALEGIRKVANAKECATICRHREECFWNTYDPEHESCLMTNDCPLLDRSCSTCSSSERDCTAETDFNTSNLNEDSEKSSPTSLFVGTDVKLRQRYFNPGTKMSGECELPVFASEPFVQYAMVDNELVGCGSGNVNGSSAMVCNKFDTEKKAWIFTDFMKLKGGSFLYYLSIPNRGILILIQSKIVYLYSGKKIEQVSEGFPFTSIWFKAPFCRTVISSDEIVVGFSGSIRYRTLGDNELHLINIRTGDFSTIKLPNLELRDSICGAYGPKGNRKVAIFGGKSVKNGKQEAFDQTLVLDWNSKTFEANGPSLKDIFPISNGQTIAYGDSFLYFKTDKTGTIVYKFDINGTETPIPFLGKIPVGCLNLAEIPGDVAGCK